MRHPPASSLLLSVNRPLRLPHFCSTRHVVLSRCICGFRHCGHWSCWMVCDSQRKEPNITSNELAADSDMLLPHVGYHIPMSIAPPHHTSSFRFANGVLDFDLSDNALLYRSTASCITTLPHLQTYFSTTFFHQSRPWVFPKIAPMTICLPSLVARER